MSSDASHCARYGHSWVRQPTLHAYICDECGRMVTEADMDDADIPRLGNRRRSFADDCEVFGHAWQEYRPAGEALFCTGLSTCRRCGMTRPTDQAIRDMAQWLEDGLRPADQRLQPQGRNLTEMGFESLLGPAGRANAAVIRTTYIDEIQPPVCAPLDHEWAKPPLGAPEEECRICRRTRKEVEDV